MRHSTPADIAVIIPHYNDCQRLDRCLEAVTSCDGVHDIEIIVIDNDSSDDIDALRVKFPSVRFVTEKSRGAAAARNRGVHETSAAMLFFLDSDCVPHRIWISAGRSALQKADIVGGAIELFDETSSPRSGAQVFEAVFAFNQKQYIEKKGFSVTANLLTWRHVFNQVGEFRPGVSEDVDWCHRAGRVGFSLIYDEHVILSHPTRNNVQELMKKWRRMVRESFQLQADRPYARLRWAARACLVFCSPAVDFYRILLTWHRHTPAEIARGIWTLLYLRTARAAWMIRQSLGAFD